MSKVKTISAKNKKFNSKNLKRILESREGLLIISIFVIFLFFTIIDPIYMQPRNIVNILEQSVVNGFLAVGITFAIVLAGIDLSIGSIYALAIVFVAKFLVAGVNPIIAVVLGIIIGAIFGGLNGVLISKMKLQPFIATLGTMSIYRGIAYIITNGNPVLGIPQSYRSLLNSNTFGTIVPISIFLLLIFVIITQLILKKTKLGTYIYSVGGNEESAFLSGIKIDKIKIIGYAMSGIGGAIAGMILLAQLGTGEPIAGTGAELNAIAATAIGGTSLAGGKGTPFAALLGAILLSALKVGLIVAMVPTFWQYVATGGIIIVAASVEFIQARLKKSKA
ncbi:ABC transporter permease [Mycoplasmatota bacterium WC30]